MEANVKDEKISMESGNQVIHIRANSDSEMQAMFDCVLKPNEKAPLTVPLRLRKLPMSFWTPPSHKQIPTSTSHSREGSADSTYGSSTSSNASGAVPTVATSSSSGGGANVPPPPPPHPQHFRHHSSPASLQPLSVAQQSSLPSATHQKQHSFDALAEETTTASLPPGWQEARTREGRIYYLDHKTQTTQWDDPRKKSPSGLAPTLVAPQTPSPSLPSPVAAVSVSSGASSTYQKPPPGQPSSSASSADATLIAKLSLNSTPTSSASLPSISSAAMSAASDATVQGASGTGGITLVNPNLGPLPHGWQQGISPDGEVYYINHNDQTTTWFDPRLPRNVQTGIELKAHNAPSLASSLQQSLQPQQTMMQHHHHSLPPIGPNVNGLGPTHSSSSTYRHNNLGLQRIHQEKEKLRHRMGRIQAEYSQRRPNLQAADNPTLSEASSRSQSQVPSPLPSLSSPQSSLAISQSNLEASLSSVSISSTSFNLPTTQSSGSSSSTASALGATDPFMISTSDFHARQESADSGLGLGGNYTHPHTPEDFLNTMDAVENDVPDVEMKQNVVSPVVVPEELPMDTEDDLVPSLMIDGLSTDVLDEIMAPSKFYQTWL